MMNKRIEKLADEAVKGLSGALNIPDEFCEKFAELIIQECISVAMLADFSGNRAWQRIKERFEIDGPIVIEEIEK
jgi:hypothetical protein